MNRNPIRYTFCDAPFHYPVQCEHSLNKPDNLSDANSSENNAYDVDTRDQVDPYDAVNLSGGDISEEESTIHSARSKFDHGAGLSPNNGDPPGLNKAVKRSTDNRLHLCRKLKRGTCLITGGY